MRAFLLFAVALGQTKAQEHKLHEEEHEDLDGRKYGFAAVEAAHKLHEHQREERDAKEYGAAAVIGAHKLHVAETEKRDSENGGFETVYQAHKLHQAQREARDAKAYGAAAVEKTHEYNVQKYNYLRDRTFDGALPQQIFSYDLFNFVYNGLSFGIASMGSATVFFFLMVGNVAKPFKPALAITGTVVLIATYHYFRIFNSWVDAFDVKYRYACEAHTPCGHHGAFIVESSGAPFNDAYRYVDWLLTVPLLLIELILVMQLPEGEAGRKMWTLGCASAFMVAFGYPGEIRADPAARWFYWAVSMCPFTYVLYELYFGLAEATKKQAPNVASLTASARYVTAISWLTYPFVYMVKGVGLSGPVATALEQVGYSMADVVAKAVFGILIWAIAQEKSKAYEK